MKRLWPLVLLSVLVGARWMLDETLPATSSGLLSTFVACAVLAAVCFMLARRSVPGRRAWTMALCGAGLLAGPWIGSLLHGAAAEGLDRVAALCFAGLCTTVLVGARASAGGLAMGRLWASLAVIAGALLVFPLSVPTDALSYLGLAVPVLAVAYGSVLLAECFRHAAAGSLFADAGWVFAGAAAGLLVVLLVARVQGQVVMQPPSTGGVLALILDGVTAGLAVGALVRTDAETYAARWAWAPVVTVVTGLAVERPGWEPRILLGAALLAGGGVWMTRREADAP